MRLLLLATMAMLLAPLAGAKEVMPTPVAWDDPTGDVRIDFMPMGTEGAALPALADALDIVNVALGGEDDEGFDIVVTLANIDAQQDQLTRAFADVNYMVGFDLTDSPFRYMVHLSYSPLGDWQYDWDKSAAPAVVPAVYGYLSAGPSTSEQAKEKDSEAHAGWYAEGVTFLNAVADFDANTISVRVPRAALERAGPSEERTIAPMAGDALTNLQAESFAWWPAPAVDMAPDEGFADASLVFAENSVNSVLRLGAPPLDEDQGEETEAEAAESPEHPSPTPYDPAEIIPIAVNLGAPTQLVLPLENRGASDVVARLTARAESEATGFAVRVADATPIAAGQTVMINLVATLDQAVAHRAEGVAIVEATTDDGAVARMAVPLIASAGPTTQANVLQVHSAPWTTENPVMQPLYNLEPDQMVWLNALPTDPLATDEPIRVAGPMNLQIGGGSISLLGWGPYAYAGMDTPLARPLALVADAPIVVDVGLRSGQPESGTLTAMLYQGDQLVGQGKLDADLNGDTLLSVELLPEATTFDFQGPAETLHLGLQWQAASAVPAPLGAQVHVGAARDLWLLPQDTRVTLPLDEAAEQALAPLVVIPEPTEQQKALGSDGARSREVPGFEAATVLAGIALLALVSRRRA